MISNTELKKNLKNEVVNLDENQLNAIRTFLVQMATIEYNFHKEHKKKVEDCQSNSIMELSHNTHTLKFNVA
ncbi:MAG: hypothetical protein RLZZ500_1930 [Bacteroidota bacterium]|jgi:hypothetical protein